MKIPFINKLFFPADSIPDTGEKPRRISDTLRKYLPGIFGFYLMLIAPAALSGKSGPFNTPGNDWVEKKSKSGITTAYRWITLENGDRFRQRKVEMIIDASLPAIVAAIKDDQSAKLWMKRVKTYYSFRETDNFHWSTYMEFSLPWPMKNQDLVVDNVLKQDTVTGQIGILVKGKDNLIPPRDHIDRIPGFKGSWNITPLEDGRIRIVYKLFSRQKPWLPLWLIDPIVESGLVDTFSNLRKQIHMKNDGNISLNYIKE